MTGKMGGGGSVIVGGFGPGSDWLRNVLADPAVRIHWGSRRFDAEARPLSGEEAAVVFENYRRDHPRLARLLGRRLGVRYSTIPHRAAEKMPAIRFDPPAR